MTIGALEQLRHRTACEDLTGTDHRHRVCDGLDLVEDVRGQQHRLTAELALVDHGLELLLQQGVQAARRLVQNQQVGPAHEDSDEPDLALVASREVAGGAARVQSQPLAQLVPIGRIDVRTHPRPEIERLGHGQMAVQVELGRQVRDPPPHPWRGKRVLTEDPDAALGRPGEAHHHPDGRGLPGSVRSGITQDLPGVHRQVDTVDRGEVTEPLGQGDALKKRSGHTEITSEETW